MLAAANILVGREEKKTTGSRIDALWWLLRKP
jgi:hypothetical protein